MSETINCGKCGMLLYFGEEISRRLYMRAIPDETAVLAAYGGTCPRCGAPLSEKSVKIEFKRRAEHVS
jgi:ribosomal protein S27AE